ncbi:MAG: glycosyltransferase family 4 protein [Planctomycetes bacterium]|nr:glycosyltransferase family 4 protein [Planctomycetota bacterium]
MRIAILSYEYPPDTGFGGIGTYSYYQARALAKLGHDVHVFAGATTPGVTHSEHDGVKVTRIKHEGWLDRMLGDSKKMRAWWFQNRLTTAWNAHKILLREHDRKPFDFVEAPECGADAMVSTTLLQVPTALKFHSPARLIMDIYDVPKIDRELTAFAEQLGINQAEVLTSCSRFLADEVAAKMHETKPIHVVQNGIDVPMFDADSGIDVFAKFGLPRDKKLIFFANRMEPRKGVHILKEVVEQTLAKYPDIAFVFAGRDLFGWMEQKILPWVKDHGLQDRFFYLGQLGLAEVRGCLKVSSIFLIPSLWENCPYSCLEAMTAGLAIVSSDCGGMPELIEDHRTGLLATNGDPSSFVRALQEMIEDEGLRERCGAAARAEVEKRLTDTAIAEQSVAVYRGFLDGNPVATESQRERVERLLASSADGRGRGSVEVANLKAEIAALRGQIRGLEGRREWSWGSALLHVVTFGASKPKP